MNKYFILPYKSASNSAKLLASSLNCKRIKLVNSRFYPKYNNYTIIINWGNAFAPEWGVNRQRCYKYLNNRDAVSIARNKIETFRKLNLNQVPTLDWTTSKAEANAWLASGKRVFARATVTGQGGAGITIHTEGDVLPDVPLYTFGFAKQYEFRVHVFNREVIHVQQKRKRLDFSGEAVSGIRNHANGWIFACNDIIGFRDEYKTVAIGAIAALGLDFGAVDLLVDRRDNAVVCEVNTAPGIEGTTLIKYTEAFTNYLEQTNVR